MEKAQNRLGLAVTTIGDLLLEEKISLNNTGHCIEKIALKIPDYQRPYKWSVKNSNQLLDDILNAKMQNKEVYRIGTLILHHDKENIYYIVDGQQRIITFSLLMTALFQRITEINKSINQQDVIETEKKVPFLGEQLPDNNFNRRNISNNYAAFYRRLMKYSKIDELEDLLKYVKENCELIVVITDDESEAFQFFDSQNARGKKLYPHDLLKAYHLREMNDLDSLEIEKIVKTWEDLDQQALSILFQDYLYRVKEWIKGNRADELNEKNLQLFKGINIKDNYPYAQFYKGAYVFVDDFNKSQIPFVTGSHKLSPFQLETPIISGKPFFEYAKHYFDILQDIQNNDKYEGYLINDNQIIKILNEREFKNGVGNRITRLLLDTSILLYVDRFCPSKPTAEDMELLKQFVVIAFIWAYSLRVQYVNLGWQSAQNYVLGKSDKKNAFNIFKVITEADTPNVLLTILSDIICPLNEGDVVDKIKKDSGLDEKDDKSSKMQNHYFKYFIEYDYYREENKHE